MSDAAHLKSLGDITARLTKRFGDVHTFGWQAAKTRGGGTKAVGTGPQAGKTLYGKRAQQALTKKTGGPAENRGLPKGMQGSMMPTPDSAGGGPKNPKIKVMLPQPGDPKPTADDLAPKGTGDSTDAANRKAFEGRKAKGEVRAEYMPDVDYTKPMGKTPPATPAETKALDTHHAADAAKYGPRAARILRGAAAAVRGLFTLGGLVVGTGLGAGVGGLVGGPLGMALGTSIGGGLGGLLGSRVRLPGVLGRAEKGTLDTAAPGESSGDRAMMPRVRAIARRAARKVLPKATAAARAVPSMVAGALSPAAGMLVGGSLGGIPGAIAGGVGGVAASKGLIDESLDTAAGRAKAKRMSMATSAVSRRKASQKNEDRVFAESFAEDIPPNAVAMIKVRLKLAARAAGVALPPIPDEVVAEALRLATQDADTQQMAECVRAAGKAATAMERLNKRR